MRKKSESDVLSVNHMDISTEMESLTCIKSFLTSIILRGLAEWERVLLIMERSKKTYSTRMKSE